MADENKTSTSSKDEDLKKMELINSRPRLENYGTVSLFFVSVPVAYIPFTKARKDYKSDLKTYDQLKWTKTQRYTENYINRYINNVNTLLITILVSLWSLLPQFLPQIWESSTWNWMTFAANAPVSWSDNWMGAAGQTVFMALIPGAGGIVYSKIPKHIPTIRGKFITNIVTKIIPVIILLLSWVLISQIRTKIAINHYEKYNGTELYKSKYESRALRYWKTL